MLTEEQKNCPFCHFDSAGDDFGDDGTAFQIVRFSSGYCINAWHGLGGEDFDVDSEYIHYCPMCGRKLGKED